jgi:dethiobiotin synthetase
MKKIFVTGIDTDIGKTIVAAILTEALEADYWKPIQAGDLDDSDTNKVRQLISNSKSMLHPEAYRLTQSLSPHAAAAIDGVKIDMDLIKERMPSTEGRDLIIEGAGGAMSPVNDSHVVMDLIKSQGAEAVIVSKHYLGSINHTLLTIDAMRRRGLPIVGVFFNGKPVQSSIDFILRYSGIKALGIIEEEKSFDREVVKRYAQLFRKEFR